MTVLVLMGVSGSGKTTVGRLLARELGWRFFEGDAFHPAANIEKLGRGIPLTEEDRAPWLAALAQLVTDLESHGQSAVIACSALRQSHRDALRRAGASVQFVHLQGDSELIRSRLAKRRGHFAAPSLLESQLDTLEAPSDAFSVDIARPPSDIVSRIVAHFRP